MDYVVSKSYIPGRFYGYFSEEHHCLADGSLWKITSDIWLERRVRKDPGATVWFDEERHFLQVKGMPYEVEVEAVELPRFVLETPTGFGSAGELLDQFEIPELTKAALKKWNTLWSKVMRPDSQRNEPSLGPDGEWIFDEWCP